MPALGPSPSVAALEPQQYPALMGRSRLVGEHFTVRGEPKKPFDDREAALKAAVTHHMKHYRCSFCGKWHLAKTRRPAATTAAPPAMVTERQERRDRERRLQERGRCLGLYIEIVGPEGSYVRVWPSGTLVVDGTTEGLLYAGRLEDVESFLS